MQWLSENWVFLLVAAVFVGLHLFGHGGHGGHGGGDADDRQGRRDEPAPPGAHRH